MMELSRPGWVPL